jgi:Flp pilus assembly protein TadB
MIWTKFSRRYQGNYSFGSPFYLGFAQLAVLLLLAVFVFPNIEDVWLQTCIIVLIFTVPWMIWSGVNNAKLSKENHQLKQQVDESTSK